MIGRHRNSNRNRRGYVLLMTLLTIAISSLLLVMFAQFSLNHAIETNMIENEMQRKWGVASIQRVAIDQSSTLLNERIIDQEAEVWRTRPLRESRARFELGGKQFDVVVGDESAKADVNRLIQAGIPDKKISDVIQKISGSKLTVNLNEFKKPRTAKEQPIDSINQIFTAANREMTAAEVFEASRNITCWSNRLNYRTATEETLNEFISALAGQTAGVQITSERNRNPEKSLKEVLQSIQATPETVRTLTRVLSETSVSQSVWIHVRDRKSESYALLVRKNVAGSVQRYCAFSW